MSMTMERIAEIEAAGADPKLDQGVMLIAELPELCRLARLGLRVEESKVYDVTEDDADGRTWPFAVVQMEDVKGPNADVNTISLVGKRVALVVLEDSE